MKKIKFASKNKYDSFPVSAIALLPAWYKKKSVIKEGESGPLGLDGRPTSTYKRCLPLFDSMTSGYMATLNQDIQVSIVNGVQRIYWTSSYEPINIRDGVHLEDQTVPSGYSTEAWVWMNTTLIKLPAGYSCLISHPMNRYDLPFITMSAVVDADTVMHEGKIPFFLKQNFEGIIKKGTPIFQILPFKRESWLSEIDNNLIAESDKNIYNLRSMLYGWYKKYAWNKKYFKDGIDHGS